MPSLSQLEALFVDVQTTGASPARGNVLEIGWAHEQGAPFTSLVVQPEGSRLPAAVTRVTGIQETDLSEARPPADIRNALALEARSFGSLGPTLAIAHYARFEEAFLRDLWQREAPEDHGPFPFTFLCLHAIGRRLHPELPRCTLHALAGLLGAPMARERRAGPHVEATRHLWHNFRERLGHEHAIHDLADLRAWLKCTPSKSRARSYPMERTKRLSLPDGPGVYHLRSGTGTLLYVGKATSLKRRVNQYFQTRARHSEKLLEMLSQVRDVTFEQTETALEAALLESDRIKELAPPYNDALRSDGRELVFADRTLSSFQTSPDRKHTLGPFPGQWALLLLRAALHYLDHERPTPDLWSSRPFGHKEEIEPSILHSGVQLFTEQFQAQRQSRSTRRDLWRLGWNWWLASRQRTEADDTADLQDPTHEEPLTPEDLATNLQEAIAFAAMWRHRAHALRLLANATVRWSETLAGQSTIQRELTFHEGTLVKRRTVTSTEAPAPASTRPKIRHPIRDIPTYDRLRVLRTELAMHYAKGAPVEMTVENRPLPAWIIDGVVSTSS